jgi:hypothetical protein
MSAEDDREDDDFDVTKEINKVLKELLKHMKTQNDFIKKTNKARSEENKSFHMTMGDREKLRAIDDQRIKENIHLRASLKGAQSQLLNFTSLLKNGVTVGTVFSKLTNHGRDLASSYDQAAESVTELENKISNLTELIEKTKDAGEKDKYGKQKEVAESDLGDAKAAFSEQGKLGKGLSAMGEFAKKNAAGILLSAGAAGTILKVLKMAFDASPMFQQMSKLLKFGVMMILRPIGDFFGFLMRPVLIMLLRKFIIPWYTKMQPMMVRMGDDIGKLLAIFAGDAFMNLFSNLTFTYDPKRDPFFGTDGVFTKFGRGVDSIDWTKVETTFAGSLSGIVPSKPLDLGFDGIIEAMEDWTKITKFFAGVKSDVTGWVKDRWDDFTKFFSIVKSDVGGWVKDRWDKFTSFISQTLGGVWETLGKYWNSFVSFFASIGNTVGYLGNLVGITAANGYDGVVTRPTMMMVGERGAERVSVTPNGQSGGGGGVTINIQNMVGSSGDIERLRSMILDVLQSSSSNRVRI